MYRRGVSWASSWVFWGCRRCSRLRWRLYSALKEVCCIYKERNGGCNCCKRASFHRTLGSSERRTQLGPLPFLTKRGVGHVLIRVAKLQLLQCARTKKRNILRKLTLTRRARHLWQPFLLFVWYSRGAFVFDTPSSFPISSFIVFLRLS